MYVAGTQCGNKKYINIKYLEALVEDTLIAGRLYLIHSLQTNLQKIVDTTQFRKSFLMVKNTIIWKK